MSSYKCSNESGKLEEKEWIFDPKRREYPLSLAERAMFIEQMMNPDSVAYNFNMLMEVKGIDTEELITAISHIMSLHEAFRSYYVWKDGEPIRVLTDKVPEIFVTEAESVKAAKDVISAEIAPFDLGDIPIRVKMFRIPQEGILVSFGMHHIMFDGSSANVIMNELAELLSGQQPEKTKYDLSYSCEHSNLHAEEHLKYFEKMFEDGLVTNELPVKEIRPEHHPISNAIRTYPISSKLYQKIESCAKKHAVTKFQVFFAAASMTVGQYCGSEDVVLGIPKNIRDEKTCNTVGMFVNMLPVRSKPMQDKSITDYLKEVSDSVKGASMHSDCSFEMMVDTLCTEKDPSHHPIFDVSLNMLNMKCHHVVGDIEVKMTIDQQVLGTDLQIYIEHSESDTKVMIQYSSELFDQEVIDNFAEQFFSVLEKITEEADLTIKQALELPETQKQVLDRFNETEQDYEKTDIVTLFRRQADRYPENICVVYKELSYTYREVDEISERIAGYLTGLGIGTEDVVSVLIPRCEYMVIASLGILKAGAAYQPLDPSYPSDRLEFMIHDATAKLLITDRELITGIPNYSGPVLYVDEILNLPFREKMPCNPGVNDLFIMLYTSGSTGIPKGVMLEHGNLTAFCSWYRKYYELKEISKVAAYASYGFDACMMDVYPALIAGAQIHIIPEEIRLDLFAIEQYFNEKEITHVFMTTQVGRQFAEYCNPKTLRYLTVGGEKLVPIFPNKKFQFFNAYGPTECTIFTTVQPVHKDYMRVPIGPAIDNIKLYVVDKAGNQVPVGVAGELWIAGHQVSRGYLNRPEKMAEVFVTNPFTQEEGYQRVYRTGDIVRWLPDGTIDFVGRNDGQVKIRGFRIELSEVEKVIREYSGIKEATVQAFDAPSGGKFIAAYIVSDKTVNIESLNAFIAERKPPYMVPEFTMQIDKIPLNQNQKVNKKALPVPRQQSIENSNKKTQCYHDNLITGKIKEILNGILGENEYDLSEDLSCYGLNSLGVTRLSLEIGKSFGAECDVKTLRDNCTIEHLEEIIIRHFMDDMNKEAKGESPEEAIKRNIVPLSGSQFGVYSECMKNPFSTLYNIPIYYTFPADMDTSKLTNAVKTVLNAHPYVFTTLAFEENDVVQKRAEHTDYEIAVLEMDEDQLTQYLKVFLKPYKLMGGRLFKIEVVKTETAVYLLTDFHHIIFDGGSNGIFTHQLKEVLEGHDIHVEEYDYFAYVNDIDENGREYCEAKEYFDQMLKNCESADEITPDLSGLPENGKPAMESVPFDMEKVQKFCGENGVTPAHLFLASVFYTVSRFTNSRNAYISTISNGRSNLKVANSFGMFVNTLPLGIELEQDHTALELVKRSREILNGAIDREQYPFARIASEHNYSPDIFYAYQIGVLEELMINGIKIDSDMIGERLAKFKTAIYVENTNGTEAIDIVYNDAQYSSGLIRTLATCIRNVVYAIIENPQQSVRKLSMLDSEMKEFTEKISSTKLEDTKIKLFHELFEHQAGLHPERKALVAIDGSYTYRELDERANCVANALIERGVKTGSKVVLLLKRDSRYFAALLGVLKAGAAYIPTCPDYPKERIETIIEDSEAEYVITYGEFLQTYPLAVSVDELEQCVNNVKPQVEVSPDDLAYLIYTSGSTGKPKGVMLKHEGIANYLTDHECNPQVHIVKENCTCYGSVTTVSFDMNLKETAVALCNGLTLAFASDEMTMDPVLAANFFMENCVDVFNATPSRLLVYMEVPEFARAMKNCKVILSGGEKYPDKLLQVLREQTDARIINTYGPTEITVSCNAMELTHANTISVGKPLYNYVEYIVDMDDNKLPAHVVGELLIGGVGVARGYNKLPEQNEKAFIEFEGQRFYRSGDYARWTENGEVIILGRKDSQVKLRGLRIELGEIEKVLTSIEGVRSGTIVIRKIGKEDAICAYYTGNGPLDENMLKKEMSKTLTDYMIPSSFNQLDELPLTPNGKINVKMLPEPANTQIERVMEKPANEIEEAFCDIFCNVLEEDEVSVNDSFFEIGGTSLTVTRVVIQASKKGYDITFGDVFANQTPRALARFLLKDEETSLNPFGSISDYDYSDINKVLEENTLAAFEEGEMQNIGNVILTGATGFLGVHILHELLTKYDGKVYCLMRKTKSGSTKKRMSSIYFYYFETEIFEKYKDRVQILVGDITDRESLEKLEEVDADLFINCAANVKHFSSGTDIEDVNYYGVKNIIKFCQSRNIRLVHVSTMSVGGTYVGKKGMTDVLKEDMLFIGQTVSSKYTNSKYLAEREILQAIAHGFNAKIMRVGTLSARNSDGEYQINFNTNTSMGRIKSTCLIGAYPYESMTMPMEFSPIDSCAEAILLLAQTPKKCVVFHPFNNHTHIMEEVYTVLNSINLPSKAVTQPEYNRLLEQAKEDPYKASIFSSFIAYESSKDQIVYPVGKSNGQTMQILYRMGFRWPVTSLEYMRQFLLVLKGLGFFDESDLDDIP